jgi:hypothetical protein
VERREKEEGALPNLTPLVTPEFRFVVVTTLKRKRNQKGMGDDGETHLPTITMWNKARVTIGQRNVRVGLGGR